MIKLIASDLDGTLVPEETSERNPELTVCIRKLKENGILFAAASGRQYASILKVFEPLRDEIFFIADNGAYVIEHERILFQRTFEIKDYQEMVGFILNRAEVSIMISSVEGDYTNSLDPEFHAYTRDNLGMVLDPVEDLSAMDINVSKIAVYSDQATKDMLLKEGIERFGDIANIVNSSSHWMDFIPKAADKGNAVKWIQEQYGITPEETMCFGDQNNDIGMLNCADESYAAAGAGPEVKAAARHIMTEGPEENGVLHIIEKLLDNI